MTEEPLTVGELWARAPLSFVMIHIGFFAIGWWLARLVNAIEKRWRGSDESGGAK